MKITILDKKPGEEDEIIIKVSKLDERILRLVQSIGSAGQENGESFLEKLKFYRDNSIVFVGMKEIFYFESIEDKVFAYTDNDVFESREKLYQLEQNLSSNGFVRANKAVIVNLDKIDRLSPAFGGRLEALLKNGYKVIFSRLYVNELKKRLGL